MRARNEAFTLFEMLMALGVFGIAVIGMLMALNGVMDAAREARIGQLVRTEMDNRLANLEAEKPRELERQVEVKSPKITFLESIRREEVTGGADRVTLSGFWRVQVQARWEANTEKREETASFLIFAP